MTRRVSAVAAAAVFLPALALAVPRPPEPRLHPSAVSPLPTYVRKVQPAVVALSVTAPAEAPSSVRLGARRAGSGVIFDARGYVVTVSYLVLDAVRIEARTRDGDTVEGRLVGVDLDTGLAVVRLAAPARGRRLARRSRDMVQARGGLATTRTTRSCRDGDAERGRRFSACWEYMSRAPSSSRPPRLVGCHAMVDERGTSVGIRVARLARTVLRNLAIPLGRSCPSRTS